MINWNKRRMAPGRVVTLQERRAYEAEVDREYPGYLDENAKLTAVVRILTGVRALYAIFYLVMTYMYGMQAAQGWLNLFGTLFFYMWYSLMLRSGKFVAVAMLVFRGISISVSGPSILGMSPYLPFPLIFTLVLAGVMEFVEAVFCIYVLFNSTAAQTVRLNRRTDQALAKGLPNRETLTRLAEYQNPCTGGEEPGAEPPYAPEEPPEKKAEEPSPKVRRDDGEDIGESGESPSGRDEW